jgi:hypothetical protein
MQNVAQAARDAGVSLKRAAGGPLTAHDHGYSQAQTLSFSLLLYNLG